MAWQDIRATHLAVVGSLPDLVTLVDDPGLPGLGTWDVTGLTGHLLRAVTTTATYLEAPEPDGEPLRGAASYLLAYLGWRAYDPAAADAAVAARGEQTLAGTEPTLWPAAFADATVTIRSMLETESGERRLPTRFGPMRLGDYLRTRTLEATVHGVDLARALSADWEPPAAATGDALGLLTEVSVRSGDATALLMALTGRDTAEASSALPVLR